MEGLFTLESARLCTAAETAPTRRGSCSATPVLPLAAVGRPRLLRGPSPHHLQLCIRPSYMARAVGANPCPLSARCLCLPLRRLVAMAPTISPPSTPETSLAGPQVGACDSASPLPSDAQPGSRFGPPPSSEPGKEKEKKNQAEIARPVAGLQPPENERTSERANERPPPLPPRNVETAPGAGVAVPASCCPAGRNTKETDGRTDGRTRKRNGRTAHASPPAGHAARVACRPR